MPLYHKHAQLYTLPQGSQRRCETNYSTTAGSPVLTVKHTGKKTKQKTKRKKKPKKPLCCNCLEEFRVLRHLLLSHSMSHLGNVSAFQISKFSSSSGVIGFPTNQNCLWRLNWPTAVHRCSCCLMTYLLLKNIITYGIHLLAISK